MFRYVTVLVTDKQGKYLSSNTWNIQQVERGEACSENNETQHQHQVLHTGYCSQHGAKHTPIVLLFHNEAFLKYIKATAQLH